MVFGGDDHDSMPAFWESISESCIEFGIERRQCMDFILLLQLSAVHQPLSTGSALFCVRIETFPLVHLLSRIAPPVDETPSWHLATTLYVGIIFVPKMPVRA